MCCFSYTYLLSLEVNFIPPRFFMVQHVHTQPAITSTSSAIDTPASAPNAIKALEEHLVLEVMVGHGVVIVADLQRVQFCWNLFSVINVTEADSDDSAGLSEIVWLCEEQAEQCGSIVHSRDFGLSGHTVVAGHFELGGCEVVWQ